MEHSGQWDHDIDILSVIKKEAATHLLKIVYYPNKNSETPMTKIPVNKKKRTPIVGILKI